MDKLRRSFRSSFRRKDGGGQEEVGGGGGVGVRQWPQDEASVKANTCTFEVKYLGTVEVSLGPGSLLFTCVSRCLSLVGCRCVRRRLSYSRTAREDPSRYRT